MTRTILARTALAIAVLFAVSANLIPAHLASATGRKAPAAAQRDTSLAPQGDPVAGMRLYQSCMGCHSLDENDVGPRHRGVVGRRAGSVPGYVYSPALRSSGIVWTARNLDRWLVNPQKLVPGAKMYFSVAKPKDRADIIAYLAKQH